MFRAKRRQASLAIVVGCSAMAFAGRARAAVCSSLPNVIYGAGGSAQVPFIQQLAGQLSALATPATIVYSSGGGACAGYADLVTPTSITGTANYWDSTGTEQTCTLDAAGDPVTFAVMGNGPELCTDLGADSGGEVASGFEQFLGPVQSVDFVVPAQSDQTSISTEAAYFIWGFDASDAAHSVSPWTVPLDIFTRSSTSYVALFVALDTGVPAATVARTGTQESSNQGTVTALTTAATNGTYESAVGFVSGEVADENRGSITVLAYQHTGQTCGYYPDSTPNAFDKINVRTGQYWLWSPIHLFAAVQSATGSALDISDPATANFIGYVTGDVVPPSGVDVFGAEVDSSTVPRCAMQAWRDGDLTVPYSYAPPAPCDCEFEYLATGTTQCQTCADDGGASCPSTAPVCRNGFCEVN